MSDYFRPYEGSRPYVFVSYAHRDSDRVLPAIRVLHDRLWRIWYDEGIPAGSDWTLNIAQHMDGCAAVLLFFSQNVVASPNCTSEIRTASENDKHLMYVSLDGSEPTGIWADFLADAERIEAAPLPADQATAISSSTTLTDDYLGTASERQEEARSNQDAGPWTIAAFVAGLLLVGALVLLGLAATGRLRDTPQEDVTSIEEVGEEAADEPVDLSQYGDLFATTVDFPDAQQERAVRAATGVRTGEVPADALLSITELYFCGNMTPPNLDAVQFDQDGACLVNGVAVQEGMVSDLSLIASIPYLERLALVRQPVEDLSALAGLTRLQELSLAGSATSDLVGVEQLIGLTTLHLEHSAVRDLTPLSSATSLARVTVSADMFPLTLDPSASFDVVLVR